MARYTEAVCRKCRREGMKLFLKGERCLSPKCAIEKRNIIPGQHGHTKKGKLSEYGIQLREKQKLRGIYGVLEKQFENYYEKAVRQKGVTGENLIRLLERRLDNVIYRLGYALSRVEARQLVSHRHFKVNGRIVNIPSYLTKAGDEIEVIEKSKDIVPIKAAIEVCKERPLPAWLQRGDEVFKSRVIAEPTRENLDIVIDDSLITEYYSR
ncbi:MAG TPA: 30S ribosomal protein S4 [Candidatus Eremiobacteraeota bacterium]|nr:MAG: 30S ribosomal protein S4 [bacterium ADurb.Bin363]HPZ08180.1 30S ribosomal protein S4 [Candidatus Eremiobacteraeota bacterium]